MYLPDIVPLKKLPFEIRSNNFGVNRAFDAQRIYIHISWEVNSRIVYARSKFLLVSIFPDESGRLNLAFERTLSFWMSLLTMQRAERVRETERESLSRAKAPITGTIC